MLHDPETFTVRSDATHSRAVMDVTQVVTGANWTCNITVHFPGWRYDNSMDYQSEHHTLYILFEIVSPVRGCIPGRGYSPGPRLYPRLYPRLEVVSPVRGLYPLSEIAPPVQGCIPDPRLYPRSRLATLFCIAFTTLNNNGHKTFKLHS